MDSDHRERQDEELQVIQAIYMDDYFDHSAGDGTTNFSLKLTPLQSTMEKDIHAQLELKVILPTRYPDDSPILKFESSKGISDDHLKVLKKEIEQMALDCLGEVMILQLAQHIQGFLHKHNKPNLSFFDQMVANQMKKEEIDNIEQQKLHEAKAAKDREKDQDVIRQVKEELQKRTEQKRKRQISQSSSHNSIDKDITRKPVFVCSRNQEHQKLLVFNFKGKKEDKKVFCSSCVGHYYDGACTLTAIEELTGVQLSLSEWKFKVNNQQKKVHFATSEAVLDSDSVSKQLQSIEQEFSFIKNKLQSTHGVLHYHCLDVDQNGNNVVIKLLTDGVSGPCLYNILQPDCVSLSLIQSICYQIVESLLTLHNKSIVHNDINLYNTFINSNNEITLSGYAVAWRISDLYKTMNNSKEENTPSLMSFGQNTGIFKREIKKGKKGDIYNLGLLILSLYLGHNDIEFPVKIPDDLPDTLRSFLNGCLSQDEEKRLTISQLSKHSFLCSKITNNLTAQHFEYSKTKDDGSSGIDVGEKQIIMPIFRDTFVQGKSRLLNEFDILEWLGKGGFGSVIKVKNKLDGNMYALKRIPLNPSNHQLYKRITREVKLLSRLNHENVVRYFNSWIEAEDVKLHGESSSTDMDSEIVVKNNHQHNKENGEVRHMLKKRKDLEELLQPTDFDELPIITSSRNNMDSSWGDSNSNDSETSSSSSFSGEAVNEKASSRTNSSRRSYHNESSEGIIFNDDSVLQFGDLEDTDEDSYDDQQTNFNNLDSATTSSKKTTKSTPTTTITTTTESSMDYPIEHLYIQMEYCEKSTLRIMIDNDLWKEKERVGRYFREILEGLSHVHSQGIIHRDLKPFNIFLDSKDRIKIGDFGLATSHTTIKDNPPTSTSNTSEQTAASGERMTGKVGTALYVAPELGVAKGRIKFSQKVDMYSLGIILFEMCYRPLATGMERVKILGMLRSEGKVIPEDFASKRFARECYVIMWLLNHSSDDRPTAKELLESGYVPPKIEDSQLEELLRHTLNQNNSSRYQRLMSTLFNQTVSPVSDQIYDSDCYGKNQNHIMKAAKVLDHVRSIVTNVFVKHGGIFIETPLLIPKSKFFDNLPLIATMMDQSGVQLCLPYDSRLSFARYLSRNNINNLRRYYFGKLYRDQRLMGSHPISIWECSFDIVTDCYSSHLPITELIYVVAELIKEFPSLVKRNFYIRLNHSSFLKAIFVQNNFTEEAKKKVLDFLNHTKNNEHLEEQLVSCLTEIGLQEHVINRIIPLFMFEGSYSKAKDVLQCLRKTKANVSSLAKHAFSELDKVIKYLAHLNVDIPVQVCTSLTSNICANSGIIFQFVAENTKKKRHGGVDILALGFCYNQLIESMSKYAECSTLPTAVGVSVAVEKLLKAAMEEQIEELQNNCTPDDTVIVCSVTNTPNIENLLQVLCELWSAGISAMLFSYEVDQDYTVEEILEYCKENSINCFVVLKETEPGFVRVRFREKEKFTDIKKSRRELCDYLKQKLSTKSETGTSLQKENEQGSLIKHIADPGTPTFLFTYVAPFKQNCKRSYEGKFEKKYQVELAECFGNNEIQVVAADLDSGELKVVAAYLELKGSYEKFESSVQDVVELYQKKGQFMKRLCYTLHKVYTESNSVTLLYSIRCETFKVFI